MALAVCAATADVERLANLHHVQQSDQQVTDGPPAEMADARMIKRAKTVHLETNFGLRMTADRVRIAHLEASIAL